MGDTEGENGSKKYSQKHCLKTKKNWQQDINLPAQETEWTASRLSPKLSTTILKHQNQKTEKTILKVVQEKRHFILPTRDTNVNNSQLPARNHGGQRNMAHFSVQRDICCRCEFYLGWKYPSGMNGTWRLSQTKENSAKLSLANILA